MKVGIVLPPNQTFSELPPTLTDTIIRTIGAASRDRATTTVFCDVGATDHGPFNVCTVDPSGGRLVWTMHVIARLRGLAKLIEKVLAMPTDQRAFMAKAGRDRVLKPYTVDAMCAATLDVYRGVMGTAPSA